MTKTVFIGIARMGSSRLAGKVLMNLGGQPVLGWVVRAARAAQGVDEVWIATSTLPADDAIEAWCKENGVSCFRGSESDVLSRFAGAARAACAGVAIRVTCDCPFLDPNVLGSVIRLQKMTGAAYVSNIEPRSFADGLDCEAIRIDALLAADAEATRPIDRECVSTWIQRNRSRFPSEAIVNPLPGQVSERYVLDTEDDLNFCREIAHRWPWFKGPPSQLDILAILEREPQLRDINKQHPMNERFFASLADEPIYARRYDRSQAALARAEKVIPLGAQTFSKSRLQFPQPSPLFVSHGQGGEVWDVDGNSYVDLVSALLPNILGYRDPDVDWAVRRQINNGISFSLATELEAELAEMLCRLIPCAEMVRFGKNGSDVTTAAVRLARAYTGRDQVLICGGYHGWHDWCVERNEGVPQRVQEKTTRIPFGMDPEHFTQPGPAVRYAAVIVEPESNPDYLRRLRAFCNETDALLIFDEIITGFRFDLGGAQKRYGVRPDLATFGKGMGNGMPINALVGRRDIMRRLGPPDQGENWRTAFYSGTFQGETLSIAAALATIAKLERENVIPKLWETGRDLEAAARGLVEYHGLSEHISFYGQPPLIRLKFSSPEIATLFRKEMIASGTLIISSHNLCAAHDTNCIKRILKSYDHTLAIIRDALDKGDVAQRIGGAVVAPTVRAAS